jgi:fibro-slime domain-containing protein
VPSAAPTPPKFHAFRALAWAACVCLGVACGSDNAQTSAPVAAADAGASDAGRTRDASSSGFDNGSIIAPSTPKSPDKDTDAGASDKPEVGGCGDGKLQGDEACDDGNNTPGDGCSVDCHAEQDFICPAPGKACVSTVVCGDGKLTGNEACDDGNRSNGDGCSKSCRLEPGYQCLTPGARCTAAKCGDKIIAADEQCEDDDDAPADGDGCSASCKLEPGFACPDAGKACSATVCNDGMRAGSEACDDGNQVVGDGCTPFCEVEPDCSGGACRSRCGDGLILPNDQEACDDGNTRDHDGCSATCQVESGYVCSLQQPTLPQYIAVPVTYRDFIALPAEGATRHPDFEAFSGAAPTTGMVSASLGTDGKPVYVGICDDRGMPYPNAKPGNGPCPNNQQLTTRENFDQWYRDTDGVNVSKVNQLLLARDATSGLYGSANTSFFPWDADNSSWVGKGQELSSQAHDFGFTSEIHYYFSYVADSQNPPTLTFSGDDDVWVFINHQLAVDLGGSHNESQGSVTLDQDTATRLALVSGQIYEIALFHAERHSPASNFNLTLGGFVSAVSHCATHCGDGKVAGDETCDDGKNDGSYGSCTADCKPADRCGDGKRQRDHEACDDGFNLSTYSTTGKPACAPGCKLSAYCGDGRVDALGGEQCDDGKNNGGYGGCGNSCKLEPRCGDKIVQRDQGEECDDGNLVGGDGCSRLCKIEVPE